MSKKLRQGLLYGFILIALVGLFLFLRYKESQQIEPVVPDDPVQQQEVVREDGFYNSKDEVALYLHTYGHLPPNYVTKGEARKKGWNGGPVEEYFGEGYALGGDSYGNREGLLPKADGRRYYECDIDTVGRKSRGAKRIIYSNDGLIFYTSDHYEHFEQLYGGN